MTAAPVSRSGSPLADEVRFERWYAPSASNERCCAFQSRKFGGDSSSRSSPACGARRSRADRVLGNGSGRRRHEVVTENAAVVAPMPSAVTRIAVEREAGRAAAASARRSCRSCASSSGAAGAALPMTSAMSAATEAQPGRPLEALAAAPARSRRHISAPYSRRNDAGRGAAARDRPASRRSAARSRWPAPCARALRCRRSSARATASPNGVIR